MILQNPEKRIKHPAGLRNSARPLEPRFHLYWAGIQENNF